MSYSESEGVIDYSYSETDVFKTAKSHIRNFIEVIIGIVIGIGLLTILLSSLLGAISCLGGCLGCEACIETAACADECGSDCMDCDFEGQTTQNVIEANQRVACDGIDCFGREGCFSCGGCGDCSSCKGVKYYTIKTSYNGEVSSEKKNDAYISTGSFFGTASHKDSNYFSFLGYFDKAEGGTQYVDAGGYIVKTLKDNMTLYPQYEERGKGQVYEFEFDLSEAGVSSKHYTSVQVGDIISGFPIAPEVEGYTFKGWYVYTNSDWRFMYGASEGDPNGKEFHFYDFTNIYSSNGKNFSVCAKYSPKTYEISFEWGGSTYTEEAKHGDTFGSVALKMESRIPAERYAEIYGWSLTPNSTSIGKISENTLLTQSMTVYGIGKVYNFSFDLSEAGVSNSHQMSVQAGKTIIGFPNAPEIEGYTFAGWYVYVDGSWALMHAANEGNPNGKEFHLHTFENLSSAKGTNFSVRAEYTPNVYVITFYLEGIRYTYEANHNDTFGSVAAKMQQHISSAGDGEFFGWGALVDATPANKINDEKLITESMTVYSIFSEAVYVRFYNNVNSDDYTCWDERYYEGQENAKFPKITDESINPGYEFKGWYTTRTPSIYDQPQDGALSVSADMNKEYYAKWEKAEYKIEYYYTADGNAQASDKYQMSDVAIPLWGFDGNNVNHKVGYEFVGWCESSSLTDTPKTELAAGTYGNKTLYAKYEAEDYNFTLLTVGGTMPSGASLTATVKYGSTYTLPAPTKEGHNFAGWYCGDTKVTDGNGDSLVALSLVALGYSNTVNSENTLNNRANLMAHWDIKTFDVAFMLDESNEYVTKKVNWNTTVSKPDSDPYKEGHTFDCWLYKGSEFDFSEPIQEDITLTAKFNINKFTVIAVIDGSSNMLRNIEWGTTLDDAIAAKNVTIPDENGEQRRFIGWYDANEGGNKIDGSTKITSMRTIYARYQQATLFTFIKGDSPTHNKYYFVGDTVDFPVDEMRGYEFNGWYTTPDFQGASYLENVEIDADTTTYYAKHTVIRYTITYYVEGVIEATQDYTISDSATALRNSVFNEKTGYEFIGWRLNNYGDAVLELPANTIGNQVAAAIFTPRRYTVTLNNEAEGAGANDEKQVTFDATFDLGTAAKEGYDFNGWSWSQNGELITDNTGKSLETYTYPSGKTAYPVFSLKKYTATWKTHDGALYNDTTTITHSDIFTRPVIDPSVDGYTFKGWYSDSDCEAEFTFEEIVTGDITVYAKFEINQYTLTIQIHETKSIEIVLNYATDLEECKKAAYDGSDGAKAYAEQNQKRFKAWVSEDGVEYTTMPAKDLVLTATYYSGIAVEWYLTPDASEPVQTSVVFEGDEIDNYEKIYNDKPTRNGYTFKDWYTSKMLYENTKATFPVVAQETWTTGAIAPNAYKFYADWTANSYTIRYYIDGNYVQVGSYNIADTINYGGVALMQPEARDGYEFVGWYIDSFGLGEPITAIDNSEEVSIYKDLYLYGKYELEKYTITFISNDVPLTGSELEVTYGQTVVNVPEPTNGNGKFFAGWYVLNGASQEFVTDGTTWINGTYQFQDDIIVYALWV